MIISCNLISLETLNLERPVQLLSFSFEIILSSLTSHLTQHEMSVGTSRERSKRCVVRDTAILFCLKRERQPELVVFSIRSYNLRAVNVLFSVIGLC